MNIAFYTIVKSKNCQLNYCKSDTIHIFYCPIFQFTDLLFSYVDSAAKPFILFLHVSLTNLLIISLIEQATGTVNIYRAYDVCPHKSKSKVNESVLLTSAIF